MWEWKPGDAVLAGVPSTRQDWSQVTHTWNVMSVTQGRGAQSVCWRPQLHVPSLASSSPHGEAGTLGHSATERTLRRTGGQAVTCLELQLLGSSAVSLGAGELGSTRGRLGLSLSPRRAAAGAWGDRVDTASGEPEGWAGWRAAVALPLSVDQESGGSLASLHCGFHLVAPPKHRPDPSHRQRGREKEERKQNQEIKTLRAATINI